MLSIRREGAAEFRNEHHNVVAPMAGVAHFQEDGRDDPVTSLRQRAEVIGKLIDDETRSGTPICMTGASWSQSELFEHDATLVRTESDEAIWELPLDAITPPAQDRASQLFLVAGGTLIATLVDFLDERALSLRTAGSHKGQSVAGMFATGAHGSAIEESGFDSHIKGLLVAAGKGRSIWLEPSDDSVLEPSFVDQFASAGQSENFYDALIHLGGIGILNAVLIEAVPRFLLGSILQVEPLPENCLANLSAGKFDDAMDHLREDHRPFFFELTFDPFRGPDHDVSQLAYVYSDPTAQPEESDPPFRDTLDIIQDVLGSLGSEVVGRDEEPVPPIDGVDLGKLVLDEMRENEHSLPDAAWPFKRMLKKWEPNTIGPFRVDVYNAAFAVPLNRLPDVIDIGFQIAPGFKRHFVYTARFATRSPASLSFLRWDRCAIINVDGIEKRLSPHAHEVAKAFTQAIEGTGIPYSMHWGKDAPSDADKVALDFGAAIDGWKAARSAILGADTADLFTSPMLRHWGLV